MARSAPQLACGFGSGKFRVQRRFAALDEIAAHNTYDRTVRAQKLPAPCDVILMPRVKRVILRNDPYYGHGNVLPVDFMICGRDLPFVRIQSKKKDLRFLYFVLEYKLYLVSVNKGRHA